MNNLLRIKNLSVSFNIDNKISSAVKNISLDVARGEALGIVGESGSGKSVTALSVLKLLPYPTAFHPSGEIYYNNKNILNSTEEELQKIRGNNISMIFQEPMTSLNPLHNIRKQVTEVLFLHKNLSDKEAENRAIELLDLVGFPDGKNRLNDYPHQLSGGQKQRVMIAMALANDPDLLIADEPTTALDVTIQAQILNLLKKLQSKLKMSLIIITHDLTIVKNITDKVIVMTNGKIVESGKTNLIFSKPKHPYTKKLLSSEPKGKPIKIRNKKSLLSTKDLKVYYPIKKGFLKKTSGFIKAVDKVNINVFTGQTLGIVGESGSGKTTLGMAVLRLIKSSGEINFFKKNEKLSINNFDFKKMRPLRNDLQVVFQDPFGSLSPRLSIKEIIGEGLEIHKQNLKKKDREKLIIDTLKKVELDTNILNRYPHEFSGGQRQRIAIARAIVLKPRFLILDEPTSALDLSVQSQIINLLKKLQKENNLGYIFISHDLRVVKSLAHQLIVLKDGKIIESGKADRIFKSPKQLYTKKLISAAFNIK
ncbi:MAG: microcin ABC transporter ATP-binding protein [Pelagibacteraceae bacterium]|nr:microcin ABC transporter ATP-binding protein [Pelagibacteraceae bacterium]|tara:strand:+ start:3583 stop:5190 length:1608 start_codon:yes stop_codon:yes gene_type:complete